MHFKQQFAVIMVGLSILAAGYPISSQHTSNPIGLPLLNRFTAFEGGPILASDPSYGLTNRAEATVEKPVHFAERADSTIEEPGRFAARTDSEVKEPGRFAVRDDSTVKEPGRFAVQDESTIKEPGRFANRADVAVEEPGRFAV